MLACLSSCGALNLLPLLAAKLFPLAIVLVLLWYFLLSALPWCKKAVNYHAMHRSAARPSRPLCAALGHVASQRPSASPPWCKFSHFAIATLFRRLLYGMKIAKLHPSLQGAAPLESKLVDVKPPATCLSTLQEERLAFRPQLPSVLTGGH